MICISIIPFTATVLCPHLSICWSNAIEPEQMAATMLVTPSRRMREIDERETVVVMNPLNRLAGSSVKQLQLWVIEHWVCDTVSSPGKEKPTSMTHRARLTAVKVLARQPLGSPSWHLLLVVLVTVVARQSVISKVYLGRRWRRNAEWTRLSRKDWICLTLSCWNVDFYYPRCPLCDMYSNNNCLAGLCILIFSFIQVHKLFQEKGLIELACFTVLKDHAHNIRPLPLLTVQCCQPLNLWQSGVQIIVNYWCLNTIHSDQSSIGKVH